MKLTHRALLLALPVAPALLGACAAPEDAATGDESHLEARPASEAAAAQSRAQCRFHRGSLPAETLGAEVPVGPAMPIETIVVLMQENRSFDSYFGHLGKFMGRNDIESAPEDTS